jgi:hypothetical protein
MVRGKCLRFGAALVCGLLALASLSALADGKKEDKTALEGVWRMTGGEVKIEFSGKEVMKIFPHGDNDVIIIVCSYSAGKDAVVNAKITGLEGKEKDQLKELLPVGLEFNFKWLAKDAAATLDDLKGDKVPPVMKAHLEGKYDQKK